MTRSVPRRLDSIDFLRGVVMVLMALDHARGMVSGAQADATNLAETTAPLFLTRWITHFCAPVFVFLAGTAAYLSAVRGKTKPELARFLWTRGLWLIFLEFTLVRFGWSFSIKSPFVVGQVIWVLGCSMILLAALVHLPTAAVAIFGIALIALHNLLDVFHAQDFDSLAWLWGILRGGYNIHVTQNFEFKPSYPLIPWVGVMAAGYGFGAMLVSPKNRPRKMLWLGLGLTAAFVLIRATNLYGDPSPWSQQKSFLFTCFSFVNCAKYPPSLLFLLMTLGPAIVLAALLDQPLSQVTSGHTGDMARPWPIPDPSRSHPETSSTHRGRRRRFLLFHSFITFGRVPLFFYLLHLPLIHLLAVLVSYPHRNLALGSFYYTRPPPDSGYGHNLGVVYGVWIITVLLLFPACRWFAQVKGRRAQVWLSYL